MVEDICAELFLLSKRSGTGYLLPVRLLSSSTKHSALEASHLSVLTKRNVGSGNEIET